MREIRTTVYITDDGKEFKDKNEAIKYENQLRNIKKFIVRYSPDLTEGRGFFKAGLVLVHAKGSHKDFVEHWCYEKFGNRIEFCMGVYGSNAIMSNWLVTEAKATDDVEKYEVLHRIEENFVTKIWTD